MTEVPRLTVANCHVYAYQHRKKSIFAYGSCFVFQIRQEFNLRVKQSIIPLRSKDIIVRVVQPDSYNYLISTPDNRILVISFNSSQPNLLTFEQVITEKLQIIDYSSPDLHPQISQFIDVHCEANSGKLGSTEHVKEIGESVGEVFGAISRGLNLGEINRDAAVSVDKFSSQNISEGTRSKWQRFKNKLGDLNDKISQAIKPASEAIKNKTSQWGEQFDRSENSFIKGVREFSLSVSSSLNQGYRREAERESSDERKQEDASLHNNQ